MSSISIHKFLSLLNFLLLFFLFVFEKNRASQGAKNALPNEEEDLYVDDDEKSSQDETEVGDKSKEQQQQ